MNEVLFKWKKIENINIKLSCHSLVSYKDSLFFIFGEKRYLDISDEIVEFSFEEKILKTSVVPLKRTFATCCQKDENLYFFGGYTGLNLEADNFVYQFNLETLTFETLETFGNQPTSRAFHCSTILNDKM
jgi:hypothetical protein